jgi:hypothetical protein
VTNLQLLLSIGIPTLAVLLTFFYTNTRINSIDQRLIVIEGDLRRFYETLGKHEGKIENIENRLK